MLDAVGMNEINKIFAVTDAMGIHRESVVIPLGTGAGRVRRMPSGKLEIIVDAETPIDEWLVRLPALIEDAVSSFGPGLCLLLLVLTPLVWSLPVALAMSELAAALPEEGGYVEWVRRAFGPFWGFQVGWWSWLNSFVDVAVYPALFADYLKFWWPGMSALG